MNKRVEELIQALGMVSHVEGGYYKEVYRSEGTVNSPKNNELRSAMSDIYFLLAKGQVSRFHKVAHDEIWNFYEGDPVELIEIEPNSLEVTKTVLGDPKGTVKYKHYVKAEIWQAAQPLGEYSLLGCTVAPGFDFADFKFLEDNKELCAKILESNSKLLKLV